MDPRRKKQIGIGITIFIVISGLVYGFWPKPITVDTGNVERKLMEMTIEEEGKTRVKDHYLIAAPVAGMLQRITLEAGDYIAAGTVIARIKPTAPNLLDERQLAISNARLNAADAALDQAEENLRLAIEEAEYNQRELTRIRNLHQNGVGSDQDLDKAKLANQRTQASRNSAEFGVKIARYELESARAAVQWAQHSNTDNDILEIKSPVEGYLLDVSNKSERPVLTGEPLIKLGDLKSLEIRVDVLSSDAIQIRPGTNVRIKRWGGDCILNGSVRMVEPAGYTKISALGVEEQRVPVIVDITSEEQAWSRLGDSYRVVVEFILWHAENVLRVPTSALFRTGEYWSLFTLENGKAHQKNVTVGHQSGLYAEILNGIDEGEVVLTHPDRRIEDGVRVEARE